jgi:gas vesicle protein
MTETIYGIFPNIEKANNVLTKLTALNYDPKEVSVIVREDIEKAGSEVGKGTAAGTITGGVVGGIAGLILGIGAIAVAGLSPLVIAGPLAAALGISGTAAATIEGAGVGALAGGFIGAMVGLGIPKETAEIYQKSIEEGKVLLAVKLKNDGDQILITKIFQDEGTTDLYTLTR